MSNRTLAIVLIGLLINLVGAKVYCQAPTGEKQARFVEQVKEKIAKLGTGKDVRVKVKLRDKQMLKGYLSEARQDNFVLVDVSTGAATAIDYSQVKEITRTNLSAREKFAVGFLVVMGIATVGYLFGLIKDR